jgi:plasmid maintenance system antidote protein VapI
MGRPAKNPEHPLTRLRKALSTPTQEMTRARFGKKVGMSPHHIKAIETGKYKISAKDAAQIASVTKVDPRCLMDLSLPLTDCMGVSLEGETKPFAAYFGDEFLDIRALVNTAFEVAEEKRKQAVFLFLFQRWLEETSEILGLGPGITNELQDGYPIQCFAAIPKYFWPKDRQKRKEIENRVKKFETDLTAEIVKVLGIPEEMINALSRPGEAITDEEAFLERWDVDQQILHRFADEHYGREDILYADVAWDLRKKKIEEAKASLQKQPKRSQTR